MPPVKKMLPPPQKWSKDSAPPTEYVTNEMLKPFQKIPIYTTQVELTLSCKNLRNMDFTSISDPYCVVYMKEGQEKYSEIDRTECINETLNPEWIRKIIVNYNFEAIQHIKFEVRDDDGDDCFESLGDFETVLSDLVAFSSKKYAGKLKGEFEFDYGEINIVADEVSNCKQIIEVQFRAQNLSQLSYWGCNDPFLVIYRSNEDGSYSAVARTEQSPEPTNPTWKPLVMRVKSLCYGDLDRSIKIECFDYRESSNHKLIGTCYTTLRTLPTFPLILTKPKSNSIAGKLKFDKLQFTEDISFLDYIRNGTQMHFAVAIDFTASNGVHTDPQSLHYLDPNQPNSYEMALQSVGEIIQHYDSSQIFPAYGFGAKLSPNGDVSHEFPLNGSASYPYCKGVDEILDNYRNLIKKVELSGPTNFAPVINNTISVATDFQDGKHYFVLLIITNGKISDMYDTKHAIVKASRLPISIIIVGVGKNNFYSMEELDSDEFRLSVDNQHAERDIVQFVPLKKFTSKMETAHIESQALAKEVLAEIPYQLTSFMESKNYKPQMLRKNNQPHGSAIVPTAPPLEEP